VLGSGIARVRNFEGNRFPFRAESHFLYFVGRHIEEALLCFDGARVTLFAEPPDPDHALWHGPSPSLEQLSISLGLEVRPRSEFVAPADCATLPPSDVESALWLEEMLERPVEAGNLSAVEVDNELAQQVIGLRLVHDEFAIEQMQQAANVTARAHAAGMRATRVGARESLVRAAIEAAMTESGMTPAYTSIVTVAGEVLHHNTSLNVMQAGDLLLVDAGAESVEGWASDVTRTWPVSGRFNGIQAEIYDAVLLAQQVAIAECRAGVRFRDLHRRAGRALVQALVEVGVFKGNVDSLLERGLGSVFFPHGLGHLLGLDVHDMEDLGDLAGYAPGRTRSPDVQERYLRLDRDLEPNMVVTIEPGFYCIPERLKGERFESVRSAIDPQKLELLRQVRGIRIEDDVLVTSGEARVLSAAIPKSRSELETVLDV
jgi:Xaa-Pro aminopeptidase